MNDIVEQKQTYKQIKNIDILEHNMHNTQYEHKHC